ncbi:hypothetical protein [Roseimaritima sediminicola]|uniref:hypothetical protein n=1 Tax=Roseimaritima sediminicola TaxID=2662066 RepID=UPI0012982C18|nr:hypothetical protein [Roseimaritima sediminicola]
MAKKKSGPNKSQEIRDYYDANPNAKPKEVVAAMEEKGLTVSPTFVSTIRSKQLARDGQPPKRRGRPKGSTKKKVGATRRGAAATTGNQDSVSLSSLKKAKEFIDSAGGIEKARATIEAIDQLSD